MTNLSKRIMDAWLAVNPEPEYIDYQGYNKWKDIRDKLYNTLELGGMENAIRLFLTPEGYNLKTFMSGEGDPPKGFKIKDCIWGCGLQYKSQLNRWLMEGFGPSIVEAMLDVVTKYHSKHKAIVSSRQEK